MNFSWWVRYAMGKISINNPHSGVAQGVALGYAVALCYALSAAPQQFKQV